LKLIGEDAAAAAEDRERWRHTACGSWMWDEARSCQCELYA